MTNGLSGSKYPETLEMAMLAVQDDITNPIKTAVNPHFKNKYATLPEICDLYRPMLAKYGLYITHRKKITDHGNEYLITEIVHAPTGKSVSSESMLHLEKNTPQGVGSAMTYLRRYDAQALLGVAQDDDDGQSAEKPVKATNNALKNEPAVKADMKALGYDAEKVYAEVIEELGTVIDSETLALWVKRNKETRRIAGMPDDLKADITNRHNTLKTHFSSKGI